MNDSEDEIFKNDPNFMYSLIGKNVEITTVENQICSGTIYVIDPIFKTVILKNINSNETVIITRHAIKTLNVTSEVVTEAFREFESEREQFPSEDNVKERREKVKNFLRKSHVDVREFKDYLKVEDHLIIAPPYGVDNCICSNTIILERMQKILASIPDGDEDDVVPDTDT